MNKHVFPLETSFSAGSGLTKRELYAGLALHAMICSMTGRHIGEKEQKQISALLPKVAFDIADRMCKESETGQ